MIVAFIIYHVFFLIYSSSSFLLCYAMLWLNASCVFVHVRSLWRSTWRTACWSAPCRTCCVTTTTTMMDTSACTSSTQLSVSLQAVHASPPITSLLVFLSPTSLFSLFSLYTLYRKQRSKVCVPGNMLSCKLS